MNRTSLASTLTALSLCVAAPNALGASDESDADESETVADEAAANDDMDADEEVADSADDESARPEKGEDDPFDHAQQFGLRLGFVYGFRIPFRYETSPFCTDPRETSEGYDEEPKICGFSGPPALDIAGSFAPFGSIEPYIWIRLGLSGEAETNTNALRVFGVGARLYTVTETRFKFFIEPAVALETEGGAGHPVWNPPGGGNGEPIEYDQDLVFHLGLGPQYDFAKSFGVYADVGANVGIFRGINTTLEVVVGAQARMP